MDVWNRKHQLSDVVAFMLDDMPSYGWAVERLSIK
jgi:hypothetical protein